MVMIALFTSLWFWISVIAFIIVMTAAAQESHALGSITIITAILLLQYLCNVDIFNYCKLNAGRIALYSIVYFPIGIVWSFAKWYFYLQEVKRELIENRIDFYYSKCVKKPTAKDNKERITIWIGYWPFSILWTLMNDFVTKITKAIYNKIAGLFDKMSDNVFKELDESNKKGT